MFESPFVSHRVSQERIDICKQCEKYTGVFCKHCSCVMPLKVKLKSSECPEQKWLSYDNS